MLKKMWGKIRKKEELVKVDEESLVGIYCI